MKKNIVFFLLLFIRITPSYAQLDTSYIQSYDSAFNHFIFKSNINITCRI